jgi:4-oxalocrotonate tautomerase
MPIVKIDLWEGRDDDTKESLIKNVSEAVAKTMGIAIGHVTVVLQEFPKKHWGMGGIPASKKDI